MIKIGTRDSKLAVWQAEHVAAALWGTGVESELVYIKTEGDLVLDTPLPLMGGKGVFTKALDDALLRGEIDIAVHSHKDIPTVLPDGLSIVAVFEREDPRDVLVLRDGHPLLQNRKGEPIDKSVHSNMRMGRYIDNSSKKQISSAGSDALSPLTEEIVDSYFSSNAAVIATSSTRRMGQWLHRYPHHDITDIRGNVQTRLRKLDEGTWDGAIFAAAGLLRLGLESRMSHFLEWMICAPAQGAVAVMARSDDQATREALEPHHHLETANCVNAERQCLNRLEGGCSAPVGVYARYENDSFVLFANVLSTNGEKSLDTTLEVSASDTEGISHIGRKAAEQLLAAGADSLVKPA